MQLITARTKCQDSTFPAHTIRVLVSRTFHLCPTLCYSIHTFDPRRTLFNNSHRQDARPDFDNRYPNQAAQRGNGTAHSTLQSQTKAQSLMESITGPYRHRRNHIWQRLPRQASRRCVCTSKRESGPAGRKMEKEH
jgi:hypothetical protein